MRTVPTKFVSARPDSFYNVIFLSKITYHAVLMAILVMVVFAALMDSMYTLLLE